MSSTRKRNRRSSVPRKGAEHNSPDASRRSRRTVRAATADRARQIGLEHRHLRADLFTHVRGGRLDNREAVEKFIKGMLPAMMAYLRCADAVECVYIYISYAVEHMILNTDNGTGKIEIPSDVLENEGRTISCVQCAADQAFQDLARRGMLPSGQLPTFQFLGSRELVSLLNRLHEEDPMFVTNLTNSNGQFTYEAPKFVEWNLRLASSQQTDRPLLRIDADVLPDPQSLGVLAAHYQSDWSVARSSLFSAHYVGTAPNDPLNQYAVRTHWLSPHAVTPFLADLGVIGAPQGFDLEKCSPTARKLAERRGPKAANRGQQPISGAGLVLTPLCCRRLPPCTNWTNTVWVDDWHKRAILEVIGDIPPTAVQQVAAGLRQDRHPDGVRESDLSWAKRVYFERLLRGCLVDACIMTPSGNPGCLGDAVNRVVHDLRVHPLTKRARLALRERLVTACDQRFGEAIEIWMQPDYGLLAEWARERTNDAEKTRICGSVADDALRFMTLLSNWPVYLRAIEEVEPFDAFWLYRRSRP